MRVNKNYIISSFKELMNDIVWSWDYPTYDLQKDKEGNFYINKLYITPSYISYKEDRTKISLEVFQDIERFYEFLKSTDR